MFVGNAGNGWLPMRRLETADVLVHGIAARGKQVGF